MTTSTIDFPVWFNGGCYGGLACCMLAIAVNTLYATWRKRGTRRQLTGGVVVCVACALLLLVAIVWYNARFNAQPGMLSLAEVELALAYVVLLGLFLPLGTSASFCLFASLRVVTTSVEIPKQKRRTKVNPSSVLRPPRHQRGMIVPFVYDQDTPWCWLDYKSGRLSGQRLALKRSIVTIGREEDNDIWIDDEQASRYHAELAWDKGDVYLTDCESLNGVLLNGLRIRGTAMVESGALLQVGSQQFLFTLAEHAPHPVDADDPLNNHTWHYADEKLTGKNPGFVPPSFYRTTSDETPPTSIQGLSASIAGTPHIPQSPDFLNMPAMPGLTEVRKDGDTPHTPRTTDTPHSPGLLKMFSSPYHSLPKTDEARQAQQAQQTAPLDKVPLPTKMSGPEGMLLFRSGEAVNKTRMLDLPRLTIGRDEDCDIVVHDVSVSRQHAQFVRQTGEDYIQDLSSQNGTFVNEQLLMKPYALRTGDIIRIGNVRLQYVSLRQEQTTPLPEGSLRQLPSSPSSPSNGMGQFKLPGTSRP